MIQQGEYDLTADALKIRGQKPIYAGDDYVFNFFLVDNTDDELPVDVTGWTLKMRFKQKLSDSDLMAEIDAVIVSGPAGHFSITIVAGTFVNLNLIIAYYELQKLTPSSETLISGFASILPQIN